MRHQATIAYLGLGSNLSQPQQQICRALQEISVLPQLLLQQTSRFVHSAPQGVMPAQPDFVNAVCQVATTLSARSLLQDLLAIEQQLGRVRLQQDGPRVIDLDLLLYGACRIAEQDLQVPHPRLHLRRFVLEPLLDVAPAIAIPGLGPAAEFLPACLDQRLQWLAAEPVQDVI